ncbi:MAG: hypothetical protein WA252_00325 [Candidatus Sulfotelmatobacter sp.]
MAYESELEAELEDEFEDESEDELEGEDFLGGLLGEGEDFLGGILGEGEEEGEEFLGSILGEGESEDFLGDILGEGEEEDFLGSILGEGEGESEDEYEDEISPIRKVYPDAVMEHLGELAAESESEDEAAEHFLPLIGMAASKLLPVVAKAIAPAAKRALPKIAKVLTKATPRLTRGIGKVAKVLHRHPQTRHLLRTVPGIARRTVGNLAHKAARGVRITPQTAVRTLARQTRRVLGSPQHRAQALRRHNHLEHKFHRRMGRGFAHPHGRQGRRYGRGLRMRAGMHPGYVTRAGSMVRRPGTAARTVTGRAARYGGRAGACSCGHCCCCR